MPFVDRTDIRKGDVSRPSPVHLVPAPGPARDHDGKFMVAAFLNNPRVARTDLGAPHRLVVLHNSVSPFCSKIGACFREVKYGRRKTVAPLDGGVKVPHLLRDARARCPGGGDPPAAWPDPGGSPGH